MYDYAIIGGGIVGIATARALKRKNPHFDILLLEKEPAIGKHQTGNNSGVIHSGIYYKSGSLKAKLCTSGAKRMVDYAKEHDIPFDQCGKVIVATDVDQLPMLDTLRERGISNGLTGVERKSATEIREIEPHVQSVGGLFVRETGIIDYPAVANSLANDFESLGGVILTNQHVVSLYRQNHWIIETRDLEFTAKSLINCAGLYSDRIALMAGIEPGVRIVPFRGEYFRLRTSRSNLVRNLIYPVPDPRFPFLGVHFTRTINHGIEAGPNAVLALSREGYNKTDFNPMDTLDALSWPGFQKLAAMFWRTGIDEIARSLSKRRFTESLQKLVPEVAEDDLLMAGAGVRAQAIARDGSLIDDFLFVHQTAPNALHVLNVPSPAATASLAIADYIVEDGIGTKDS